MQQELYDILRSEVKPALGCTGPIGICYAAAQAKAAVGGQVKSITAKMDWGMSAKCDDVGFPGTEYLGVELALALGAVCGDPKAGLEVLHTVTPQGEEEARKLAKDHVTVQPQWQRDNLDIYLDVTVETDRGTGRAVVAHRSDGLVYQEANGKAILGSLKDIEDIRVPESPIKKYTVKDCWELASSCPLEQLEFLGQAREYNLALAQQTLEHSLGAGIGGALYRMAGENAVGRAKGLAAAGCEARMSGLNLPAMSLANKGNVGIAASLPLVSLAMDEQLPQEKLLRAMALSYLVAIMVIHRIGKSPALCSCMVAASLGVAAGTVLLHSGTEKQAEMAIQNMVPNVFGVVCDGAKLACALRMATSTGAAMDAANLALSGVRLANNQGVLCQTADETIEFLGQMGLHGMVESDRELSRAIFQKRVPLRHFQEAQQQ